MDPITHGLLGATLSQVVFARKLKRHAWIVGALAAMSPDLDVIIQSANDPSVFMLYHRHFTHALLFIPFGGFIIGLLYWLLLLWRHHRLPFWPIIFAAILGYSTHGLLDACTSYGTMLFWPFSNERVAWDIVAIVDPVFTSILLISVIASAMTQKKLPAFIGLIVALSYLAFFAYWHHQAELIQQKLIASRHQTASHSRVMPIYLNYYRWNSVYIADDKIYVDGIDTLLTGRQQSHNGVVFPLFHTKDLPANFSAFQLKNYQVFNWFSQGYISAISQSPLTLIDARYMRQLHPPLAAWGIQFNQKNSVTWLRRLKIDEKLQ